MGAPALNIGPWVRQLISSRSDNVSLAIFAAVALLLIVLIVRLVWPSTGSRRRAATRYAKLPGFDVEGGAPDYGAKVLPAALGEAAASADVGLLRKWLSDDRCSVDATLPADGGTALHEAARHGHAHVVRLLLDHGADALNVDAEMRTPLHLVALGGHGLCVKALLDSGADPMAPDAHGATPLSLAEEARHVGTARMMRLHCERVQVKAGGSAVARRVG